MPVVREAVHTPPLIAAVFASFGNGMCYLLPNVNILPRMSILQAHKHKAKG